MFLIVDNPTGTAVHTPPPLDTLTDGQVAAITLGLENDWSIDRIVNSAGQLSLMLTPPTSRNLDVVFHIDRDEHGLNLSLMQGDELQARGSYEDVDTLLSAVRFIQRRDIGEQFALRRSV